MLSEGPLGSGCLHLIPAGAPALSLWSYSQRCSEAGPTLWALHQACFYLTVMRSSVRITGLPFVPASVSITVLILFPELVPGFILGSASLLVPLGPASLPGWSCYFHTQPLAGGSFLSGSPSLFSSLDSRHILPLHWATPAVSFLAGRQQIISWVPGSGACIWREPHG